MFSLNCSMHNGWSTYPLPDVLPAEKGFKALLRETDALISPDHKAFCLPINVVCVFVLAKLERLSLRTQQPSPFQCSTFIISGIFRVPIGLPLKKYIEHVYRYKSMGYTCIPRAIVTPKEQLTWVSWKITMFDRRYIINWLFFHCHVTFPGLYWLFWAQKFLPEQFILHPSCPRRLVVHRLSAPRCGDRERVKVKDRSKLGEGYRYQSGGPLPVVRFVSKVITTINGLINW